MIFPSTGVELLQLWLVICNNSDLALCYLLCEMSLCITLDQADPCRFVRDSSQLSVICRWSHINTDLHFFKSPPNSSRTFLQLILSIPPTQRRAYLLLLSWAIKPKKINLKAPRIPLSNRVLRNMAPHSSKRMLITLDVASTTSNLSQLICGPLLCSH